MMISPILAIPAELQHGIFKELSKADIKALSACNKSLRRQLLPWVFTSVRLELVCQKYVYITDVALTSYRIKDLLGGRRHQELAASTRSLVRNFCITTTGTYLMEYARYQGNRGIPIGDLISAFPNLTRFHLKLKVLADNKHPPRKTAEWVTEVFREIGGVVASNGNISFVAEVNSSRGWHHSYLPAMSNLTEFISCGLEYLDAPEAVYLAEAISNSPRLTRLDFGHEDAVNLDDLLSPIYGQLALKILRVKTVPYLSPMNARKLANLEELDLVTRYAWSTTSLATATADTSKNIWESLADCGIALKIIRYCTYSPENTDLVGLVVYLRSLYQPVAVDEVSFDFGKHVDDQCPAFFELYSYALPRFLKARGYEESRKKLESSLFPNGEDETSLDDLVDWISSL